ncbi:hypothetical protein NDU88_003423 [Pleurodeles waltl]|uniref:Uncharacterized protein n=1 Tax=Pleurodeles waltl TaxID=8319 RepID=A0AAV7W3H6_PLEWA|nr:hypothetical protein NDU88_003423 [Pleurodeles waltl]
MPAALRAAGALASGALRWVCLSFGLLTRPKGVRRRDAHTHLQPGSGRGIELSRKGSGYRASLERLHYPVGGRQNSLEDKSSRRARTGECMRGSDHQDHLPRCQFVVWSG